MWLVGVPKVGSCARQTAAFAQILLRPPQEALESENAAQRHRAEADVLVEAAAELPGAQPDELGGRQGRVLGSAAVGKYAQRL